MRADAQWLALRCSAVALWEVNEGRGSEWEIDDNRRQGLAVENHVFMVAAI